MFIYIHFFIIETLHDHRPKAVMEMILYFPNNGDGNYFIMIITLIMSLYKLKIFERTWHLHTNNLQLSTRRAKLLPLVILHLHHLQHTGLAATPPLVLPLPFNN